MKFIKLFILFSISFLLISCNETEELKEENIPFDAVLNDISANIPHRLTENLNLSSKYKFDNRLYDVSLESTNVNFVNHDGKIKKGFKDTTITLKLTVAFETLYKTRDIDVIVPKMEHEDVITLLENEFLIDSVLTMILSFQTL